MRADHDVELEIGSVLERRYVLRDCLGKGGMGTIFRADQIALERAVVIKVLHPALAGRGDQASRIRNEALAACRVRNPHCVEMIDFGVLPGDAPYIVMEYVPGRPLARVVAEESIPLARAVDLLDQILSALGATHDAGIVHADVTSDNFLVELIDGRDHVTMIDFGLARVAEAPACDRLETVSGTPEYMAPEVIRGAPPIRASDLYAAGVILYELLTGTTPFGGGPAATIMRRHLHEDVVPPSLRRPDRELPPAVDAVVLRALDKRPEARFPDAATFAHELRTAAGAPRCSVGVPTRRAEPTPGAAVRNHDVQPPRRRLARGSDCGGSLDRSARLGQLRHAIGEAIVHGDVERIASGYLELADTLGSDQRFVAAAHELHEGIDILTAGRGPSDVDAPQVVNRLQVALAALHEQSGSRCLARREAADADRCGTLTDTSL